MLSQESIASDLANANKSYYNQVHGAQPSFNNQSYSGAYNGMYGMSEGMFLISATFCRNVSPVRHVGKCHFSFLKLPSFHFKDGFGSIDKFWRVLHEINVKYGTLSKTSNRSGI